MKNKVTVIIAARMGSSRFKGKTMSDLYGKPLIYRLIERVKFSKNINDIIIATTKNEEDNSLKEWCDKENINCFRGSSNDVLGRLKDAAIENNVKTIVEILGDNPLVHSTLIDSCIEKFILENSDYTATVTNEYPKIRKNVKKFPIGIRVQVLSIKALIKCEKLANTSDFREHATSYIAENPNIFNTSFLEAKDELFYLNRPDLTFAVNYPKQLELINYFYKQCYFGNNNFSLEHVLKCFDANRKELKKLMFPDFNKNNCK